MLDPGEPFPVGTNSDYCHACWLKAGGVATVKAKRVKTAPVARCPHLSPETKRIGLRTWQQCTAGYGSTTVNSDGKPDERAGHVCGCGTATPGVWRLGKECGPACAGYPGGKAS